MGRDKMHPFYIALVGIMVIGLIFLVIFKIEDYREKKKSSKK
jgi:hypothetical protein